MARELNKTGDETFHLPLESEALVAPAGEYPREDSHAWFCLRTQQKKEHIAAARVRTIEGVEVYCPRLRYQKMTRRGKVWFREALFPGYIFARIDLFEHQKIVTYAQGVTGIVKFGLWPTVVPDSAINELRSHARDGEHEIIPGPIEVGKEVIVASGPFKGLGTLVTQVLPANQRVKILLEFLGDCREVEISAGNLLVEARHILAA
jgi:transcriptional antiterminator RfaH